MHHDLVVLISFSRLPDAGVSAVSPAIGAHRFASKASVHAAPLD
jgi:hypothetical protein